MCVRRAHLRGIRAASSGEFAFAAVAAGAFFVLPSLARRSSVGIGNVKFILLLGAGFESEVMGAIALAYLALFPLAVATLRGGLAVRKTALPSGPFFAGRRAQSC